MFAKEYQDLSDLLLNNERAQNFYTGLTASVQQELTHQGSHIHTMKELRKYAKVAESHQ